MSIALNNGYLLEGDATTAAKVTYVITGSADGSTLATLASGQLPNAKGTLYTASGVDTISSITLFNTNTSAEAVNLYVQDGTASRQILGIDALGAGYHALFDGNKLYVLDANGQILSSYGIHAASHTDGTDDIQDATAAQKGVATAAQITKLDGIATGANLYVHPNHSGEVTSVADGAQTIANDAVTYAKMQNVSATDKVLGRATAGAGDVEEIACTAAGRALLDDVDATAQKTTLSLNNVENTAHSTDAHTMTIDGVDVSAHDVATTGVHGVGANNLIHDGTDVTGQVTAASDSAQGKVELATAAETTTGTDTGRAVTPDGLAGSIFGEKLVYLKVIAEATALTTGDGKMYFTVPDTLNGMNLVDADAAVYTVSSSGTPTVQIYNLTQTADMLSTLITIDANELTSYTAAAQPVIDTNNDDVATGNQLRIDVDVAGTGTTGLDVILTFQLP